MITRKTLIVVGLLFVLSLLAPPMSTGRHLHMEPFIDIWHLEHCCQLEQQSTRRGTERHC